MRMPLRLCIISTQVSFRLLQRLLAEHILHVHRSLLDTYPAYGEEAVRCPSGKHSQVSLSGNGQSHAEHQVAQKWARI